MFLNLTEIAIPLRNMCSMKSNTKKCPWPGLWVFQLICLHLFPFIHLLIPSFHLYMLNSLCVPNLILDVDNMDTP